MGCSSRTQQRTAPSGVAPSLLVGSYKIVLSPKCGLWRHPDWEKTDDLSCSRQGKDDEYSGGRRIGPEEIQKRRQEDSNDEALQCRPPKKEINSNKEQSGCYMNIGNSVSQPNFFCGSLKTVRRRT